tara:strand:+ start:260 stop:418 length:159 start_codon:yes stop_codon:yes gene_type:complete
MEIMCERFFKSDSNYPENFWLSMATLLSVGAFIYRVLTSQISKTILNQYLFE